MASKVVVLGFDSRYGAEGMLGSIQKWEEEGLIELEDAVVAWSGPSGQVQIEQTHKQGGKFTARGGGVGLLAGLLLGGPVVGLVGGATIGAIAAALKDYGLDDDFVHEVSQAVKPESSALFLLVKEAKADEIEARLRPHSARILTTSLDPEQEKRLRRALEEEEYH